MADGSRYRSCATCDGDTLVATVRVIVDGVSVPVPQCFECETCRLFSPNPDEHAVAKERVRWARAEIQRRKRVA